jgi:hypothetical protein
MIPGRTALIVIAGVFAATIFVPCAGVVATASAQTIVVSSATPASGEQGSANLNVIVKGKGFKAGATAKFYKTGTTDPGGVTIKSTQYVSSTQVNAVIDIADLAALSRFDIQVANADGRTGKGTELFSVLQKKLPPPEDPLALSDGLNAFTVEINSQLRALSVADGAISETWAQLRTAPPRDVLLLDVDGDRATEAVLPGACQDTTTGKTYVWLTTYKQGIPGESYSGACSPNQSVEVKGAIRPELGTYLDRSTGAPVVVLRTQSDIVEFQLQDGSWLPLNPHVDISLYAVPAGATITARSLAVGDADGDGSPEVVTITNQVSSATPTTSGYSDATVLVFDAETLLLEGSLALADSGFDEFVANVNFGLLLADTDGDGTNEIWSPGSIMNATRTEAQKWVLSFKARTTPGSGYDTISIDKQWDYGWGPGLVGPKIAGGRWTASGRDSIVLFGVSPYSAAVEVWDFPAIGETAAVSTRTFAASSPPNRAFVIDGRLIIGGTLPAEKRLKSGFYLESWDASGTTPLRVGYYGNRDGSELSTFTAGLASRRQ